MFEQKLKSAIQKYLDGDTKLSKSGAKGAITRLVNKAALAELILIPQILEEFDGLPNWLKLRFQKGSLYQEGDRVFGWYYADQVQAEPLPLKLCHQQFENYRYCEVLDCAEEWEIKGFAGAVPLPLTWSDREVEVPVEELRLYCEHGYASPCKLQWERKIGCSHPGDDGYYVTRSIIPYGFWQSWKWWPDAWAWYYEHRPELFEDEVFWRAKEWPVRHSPSDNPYAAVLGTASRSRPTFFLDD
jgi:hypothetical protein